MGSGGRGGAGDGVGGRWRVDGSLDRLHDALRDQLRDADGRPVTLVWSKRGGAAPSRRAASGPGPSATRRSDPGPTARGGGEDATDVARVATELGVGWATVMRAVWEYGRRILDQQWLHSNITVLGLDETAFLAATAAS